MPTEQRKAQPNGRATQRNRKPHKVIEFKHANLGALSLSTASNALKAVQFLWREPNGRRAGDGNGRRPDRGPPPTRGDAREAEWVPRPGGTIFQSWQCDTGFGLWLPADHRPESCIGPCTVSHEALGLALVSAAPVSMSSPVAGSGRSMPNHGRWWCRTSASAPAACYS